LDKELRKRLTKHLNSLRGIQRVLQKETGNIEGSPVRMLQSVLGTLQSDAPDVVPAFDMRAFFSHTVDDIQEDYYRSAGILAYLATAIAALEAELDEDDTAATPVTEHREFAFVTDPALRAIIERDYAEIQRAFIARCYKSTIILTGGAIEAILLDLLTANKAAALASQKAPRQGDISQWDLKDLIAVAIELGLITASAEKFGHSVRGYRNLIHPGNEMRSGLEFDEEEAKIAIEVLHILHRDLS